jgi:hypothetical protein
MKKSPHFLLISLVCFFYTTISFAGEITTWIPPYRLEQSRKSLQYKAGPITADQWITRIGLQFWLPTPEGNLRFAERGEHLGPNDVAWFAEWGRSQRVKILLTLYNFENDKWDWDLARAAFKNHPKELAKNLLATVERYRLDGVDIDLEGNGFLDADRTDFARFIVLLSKSLKAKKKILTIDSFHSPCFNAPHMGWWEDWKGRVDAIHSMGYGDLYEGSTESFTPDNGEVCAQGAAIFRFSWQAQWGDQHGIPAAKVLMGIPGGQYEWGKDNGRKTLPEHLKDVEAVGAGICIWDVNGISGGRQDNRWGSEEAWKALKAFREGKER